MKSTLATRIWRSALAWCGVLLLVAAMAIYSWTTHPATLPAVPAIQSGTLPPLAQAKRMSRIGQPVVAAAIPPPTTVIDNGDTANVLRLRARGLTVPVSAVSAAQLTDTYSQPRTGGTAHEALDIMAPRGTPVLAVEDGRVAKLFFSKAGGVTLYQFDPGTDYVYYYAHLDRYAEGIVEGDPVLKGQVIGYVGSTGNASMDAPHLHFAVARLGPERHWWRGTPINPFVIWRNAKS